MQQKWQNDTEGSQQLKALHNDLEAIAQATSHQLKDPLRQAVIDIEKLQHDYSQRTLDDNAQLLLGNILHSISNVICRIEYIREFSRLVDDKSPFVEVSCDDVIEKVITSLDPLISEHHAIVTHDTLPTLYGKEKQLITLFSNLISNAILFNDSPSPEVLISAVKKGDLWEFSLSDNGVGVEEVYRDLVFALFQSLDCTKDTHGAGLAFCKRIIQNHHGKIWYKPNEDKGTCFYFTIGALNSEY